MRLWPPNYARAGKTLARSLALMLFRVVSVRLRGRRRANWERVRAEKQKKWFIAPSPGMCDESRNTGKEGDEINA